MADIGAMTAAGAVATIVFSVVWGRLSDFSGKRKRYLLMFFALPGPVLLALSVAGSVPQLILFYTLFSAVTCGISPIAVMYTVECSGSGDWRGGIARYNSLTSLGNLLGLATYTVVARFYETQWLFYVSAAMSLLATLLLWRTGKESEPTPDPEKHRSGGSHGSESSFLSHLDIRKLRFPMSLSQLTSLQLLFLAAFVHWTGITFFNVGQTPLMKALGLSDSLILAINCIAGTAQAIAFVNISPHIKLSPKSLIRRAVVARGSLILCWAALPILLLFPMTVTFASLLTVSTVWNVVYTIIWLPITNFAVSQAPAGHKGSVQGELLAAIGVANAIGSSLGGLAITAYGYTVGFIAAAAIAFLMLPIVSRIDAGQADST